MNRKPNHIIIFICTAFWFKVNANSRININVFVPTGLCGKQCVYHHDSIMSGYVKSLVTGGNNKTTWYSMLKALPNMEVWYMMSICKWIPLSLQDGMDSSNQPLLHAELYARSAHMFGHCFSHTKPLIGYTTAYWVTYMFSDLFRDFTAGNIPPQTITILTQ